MRSAGSGGSGGGGEGGRTWSEGTWSEAAAARDVEQGGGGTWSKAAAATSFPTVAAARSSNTPALLRPLPSPSLCGAVGPLALPRLPRQPLELPLFIRQLPERPSSLPPPAGTQASSTVSQPRLLCRAAGPRRQRGERRIPLPMRPQDLVHRFHCRCHSLVPP
jgi:hypothetical protein